MQIGVPCLHIAPVMLDGERVSSQRIRQTLDAGQVEETARLLGRPYVLSGNVAPGKKLGSKLGFQVQHSQRPTFISISSENFPGMVSMPHWLI